MDNKYKIYSLREPDSEIVRYIGVTGDSLIHRMGRHTSDRHGKYHRARWLNKMWIENKRPVIELIEDGLSYEEAMLKEVQYILLFKSFGARLVNTAHGGIGVMRDRKMSEESKNKISKSKKGTKLSLQTRERMSAYRKGRKLPEEWRLNISKGNKGKLILPESIIKRTETRRKNSNGYPKKLDTKHVYQFSLNNVFIKEFRTTDEAALEIRGKKRSGGTIHNACIGKTTKAYNYKWSFTPPKTKLNENIS